MIKVVFMDLVPYLIDENQVLKKTWDTLYSLGGDAFKTADDNIRCEGDFDSERNSVILKKSLTDDEIISLSQLFLQKKSEIENEYFQQNKFPDSIKRFIEDAKAESCKIIIVSSNNTYLSLLAKSSLPENVTKLNSSNSALTFNQLLEEATKINVGVREFLCLTQEQTTIDDILENDSFCATINDKESNDDNLITIPSIYDLDFSRIAYSFYECCQDEGEDL